MGLNLGNVDAGAMPASKSQYLDRFHYSLADSLKKKGAFRDETNSMWRNFIEIPGNNVRELQQFLYESGFMSRPEAVDGIFGYTTAAAVRLFQEYVRVHLGDSSIGVPDGSVGPNTLSKINNWKQNGLGVCDWGRASSFSPTAEFSQWLQLLATAKDHFQFNPSPVRERVETFSAPTDTRKIMEWDTSPGTIHMIGLRTSQDTSSRHDNDDLFILLINGMVFKFWGSTDPNPKEADRSDIPFLVEGQHVYKFGWHKIDDAKKVYRALRAASAGVLVFRDKNGDRALTDFDIAKGIDKSPNDSINIHWSGIGRSNFSAGCQVIAGNSYFNEKGELVDCSGFAAVNYDQLGGQKTRGAYNVFTDLLLAYAPSGVNTIAYTLGRDETLRLSDNVAPGFVRETVDRMKRA